METLFLEGRHHFYNNRYNKALIDNDKWIEGYRWHNQTNEWIKTTIETEEQGERGRKYLQHLKKIGIPMTMEDGWTWRIISDFEALIRFGKENEE